MANLRRAFPNFAVAKVATKQTDKSATLDAPIAVTLAGEGYNLGNCRLNATINITLVAEATVFPTKGFLNETIPVSLVAEAEVVRTGQLNQPIPLTLTGFGAYGQNGLLAKSITLSLVGFGTGEKKGSLNRQLEAIKNMSLEAFGKVPNKGTLAAPITLTLAGQGQLNNGKLNNVANVPLTLTGVGVAYGVHSVTTMTPFTGDAVLEGRVGNSVTLPAFTGDAVVTSSRFYDGAATMPSFAGLATTGHTGISTLPALQGSAQIEGGNLATQITTLPKFIGDADLIPDSSAYSYTTIPAFTGSSTVVSSSTGLSQNILPSVVGDAVLLAGKEITSISELPALIGDAVLVNGQILISVLTLPALTSVAVLDNGVPLTAATFVFNTENMAATEYSNYDFMAMAMFNGVPVGIGSGGIYELSGDDDAGVDIDVDVLSGFDDLGTEDLKRMYNAYVGYKSDGDVRFQVSIDGEPAVRSYIVSHISNTSGIKRGRAKPAKGLKSRYWQVGVKNVAGSDIELEDLGLYVQQFNRKAQ